jgi:hypothetical protein
MELVIFLTDTYWKTLNRPKGGEGGVPFCWAVDYLVSGLA